MLKMKDTYFKSLSDQSCKKDVGTGTAKYLHFLYTPRACTVQNTVYRRDRHISIYVEYVLNSGTWMKMRTNGFQMIHKSSSKVCKSYKMLSKALGITPHKKK